MRWKSRFVQLTSSGRWSVSPTLTSLELQIACLLFSSVLTTFVKSGYLSYRGVSVSLNQSGHSPLTSLIDKAFPSAELSHTFFVVFFRRFLKILSDQQTQKHKPAQLCRSQSHSDPLFFPFVSLLFILMFYLNINWPLTLCTALLPHEWHE